MTDIGDQVLRAGDCAAFPAGVADGHHLQNRSEQDAVLLVVGSRRRDVDICAYPASGLAFGPDGPTAYPPGA